MLPLRLQASRRHVEPQPPRWEIAFGRSAPLEVDLGCGRGEYAFERARSHPEVDVVALETRKKWIDRLRTRSRNADLRNLRAIRCDVTQDLSVLFGPGSISAITIHHPDPWWKKRHHKRRLVQPAFVELLARLLRPGGFVFLQTDVPDLAEEMSVAFASHAAFDRLDGERCKRERLGELRSHREKRCLRLGIPIQRIAFARRPERI
jgi:tRNA (guanine-N7-)-methyltransferase